MLFLCRTGLSVVTGDSCTNACALNSGLSVTDECDLFTVDARLELEDSAPSDIGLFEELESFPADIVSGGNAQCFCGERDRLAGCIGGAGSVGDTGESSKLLPRSRLLSLNPSSKSTVKPPVAIGASAGPCSGSLSSAGADGA